MYASADLGLIAYETPAREGLILDEGVLVEIVRPGTGDPVPPGEVGEVVVTTLQRRLPADPLRHRRPFGGAARRVAVRPHERAHQGLDGPRRPEDQGQGMFVIRRRWPTSSAAIPKCGARASSSTIPRATTG